MAPARSGKAAPKATAPRRRARGAFLGILSFGLSAMRWAYLKWGECTRPSSKAQAGARPQYRRVVNARNIAARLEDVLDIGLYRPARLDLISITDLDQGLVISRRLLAGVDIEAVHGIRDAGIGEADGKPVIGPSRNHAGESDTGIEIEVDKIAIIWRAYDATEHADALGVLTAGHAPDELIDDAVQAPIVVEHLGGIAGDGDHAASGIEAPIGELAEVIPAAELDGTGKFVLIIAVSAFGQEQRRGVEAEVETVAVAHLGIGTAAVRRGIAIIDADHKAQLLARIDLDPHTRGRQRIGWAASRQVRRRDRRPTPRAVEKPAAALADDELGIGGELPKLDGELVIEQMLLKPQLEQTRGWRCLET